MIKILYNNNIVTTRFMLRDLVKERGCMAKQALLKHIEAVKVELDLLKNALLADNDYGIYQYLIHHYDDIKQEEARSFSEVLYPKLIDYLAEHFPFLKTEFDPDSGKINLYLGHWYRAEHLGYIDVVYLTVVLEQSVVNYLEKYERNQDVFKLNMIALEELQTSEAYYQEKKEKEKERLLRIKHQLAQIDAEPEERTLFGKPKNPEVLEERSSLEHKIKQHQLRIEQLDDEYKLERVDILNRIVFPELDTLEALKLQDFVTSMGYAEVVKLYDSVEQFIYHLLSISDDAYFTYLKQLTLDPDHLEARSVPKDQEDDTASSKKQDEQHHQPSMPNTP